MKIQDRVRAIIADALYLDADDVTNESRLMADLGAESIDFLDIMFRLEKEFQVKLPKGDIERRARGPLSEAQFAVDGRLTADALENLKVMLPEVNRDQFRAGLMVRDIPTLFTVTTFARMVEQQMFGSVPDATGVHPEQGRVAGSRV